ncbi:MAG TPA: FAD:protein FMN transferase [Acidimicrobiales bacterium]|nr:FAD:protein FMN transferase [Acidimicrobiales bacterium]
MGADLRFRCMGTWAHVIVSGGPRGLGDVVRARLSELEKRWSRFIPSSELMQLNAAAGRFFPVSPETLLLIRRGVQGWHQTRGLFDPTMLGALIRAGYDRDFDLISRPGAAQDGATEIGGGCQDILVFGNFVWLPAATGFDSGGIGKGLAADIAAREAMEAGADGVLVNLGGDLCARGSSPEGSGWTVSVEHPQLDGPLVLVGLMEGAIATSTTLLRRWSVADEVRHHLIDPGTGLPAVTDVGLATVVARDAWHAEVLAKALVLSRSQDPLAELVGTGAEGLVVRQGGEVIYSEGFADFVGDQALPDLLALEDQWAPSRTPGS